MLRHVFLSLLVSVAASAQPLVVESATPDDYASGVELATQISFTFSDALVDVSQGFGTAPTLVTLPNDAIEITATEQSTDGRTVTYSVALQPDTRYVFLLLDATASGGERLARPFALNLTTARSSGSFRTSGTISDASGQSLDGSIVALLSGNLATGAVTFAGATVLEGESGSYAVGPAPLSLYTVGAVRLPFGAGAISPEALAFGLYDPNGDGTPDLVFATSGIDVTLAAPPPITAAEQFAGAERTASGEIADPELLAIEGPRVNSDGRAGLWRYTFQDGDGIEKTDVIQVGPLGLPLPNTNDMADLPTLPVPFVDSDSALAQAEALGGAAFRSRNAERLVITAMTTTAGPGDPAWVVRYVARASQGGENLDALTIEVPFAIATSRGASPEASGVWLRLASANPTSGAVRAEVVLASATHVRLDVLDARGRVVQRLYDGEMVSGERAFSAALAPTLASGAYSLRLVTPEATRSAPLVLSR